MPDDSVNGTWLGNYYYSQIADPHGFEAVFVQSGSRLEGSILDDGQLGEAHVVGTFASHQLKFCKIYNAAARNPIHYDGTLSEDGKSLSGKWRIDDKCHGSWRAWRLDDEKVPESEETSDERQLDNERATLTQR